jgi:hypothetical protein
VPRELRMRPSLLWPVPPILKLRPQLLSSIGIEWGCAHQSLAVSMLYQRSASLYNLDLSSHDVIPVYTLLSLLAR